MTSWHNIYLREKEYDKNNGVLPTVVTYKRTIIFCSTVVVKLLTTFENELIMTSTTINSYGITILDVNTQTKPNTFLTLIKDVLSANSYIKYNLGNIYRKFYTRSNSF